MSSSNPAVEHKSQSNGSVAAASSASPSTRTMNHDEDSDDAMLEDMVSDLFDDVPHQHSSSHAKKPDIKRESESLIHTTGALKNELPLPPPRIPAKPTASLADLLARNSSTSVASAAASASSNHSFSNSGSGSQAAEVLSPIPSWSSKSSTKRAKLSSALPPMPAFDAGSEETKEQNERDDTKMYENDEREDEMMDDDDRPRSFKLESRPPPSLLAAAAAKAATKSTATASKRRSGSKRARSPSPAPASASSSSTVTSSADAASDSAAASASSSSSILARLAEQERAARALPLPGDEPPYILHDGSVTSDAASGLLVSIPSAINRRLRPYQREGVAWLFRCWRRGEGGILGDEMGLGKTIQVASFLASLFTMKSKDGVVPSESASDYIPSTTHPILLIAPATILTQWSQELREWCPFLTTRICHGSDKETAFDAIASKKIHILITSYETCLSQLNNVNHTPWSLAILDEVHRLKNPEAKSTIAYRNQLGIKIKIGLTGTAIQNDYLELWCLFDVLMPKGTQLSLDQFKRHFWKPIKLGQKYGAPLGAIHLKDARIAEMNVWLSKVMLRREKKQVKLDLPAKTDNVVFCALSEMQIRVYERMLAGRDIQSILNWTFDPQGIMTRSYPSHYTEDGCFTKCSNMCPGCLTLPCITYLGKIANSLNLVQLEHKPDDPFEEKYRAKKDGNVVAEEMADKRIKRIKEERAADPRSITAEDAKRARERQLAKFVLGEDADAIGGIYRSAALASLSASEESCGKLKALRALLRVWYRQTRPRCKVLIFSNSTQMLDILGAFTTKQGYVHRRIDGSTPNKKRSQIVKEFHDNDALFLLLLSTKAGGVGLNLTCSNKVVIIDPNWNPANDLQAQDRTYRIGQTRDVDVYRLVSAGCIEEQIYLRQVYKQQLALAALHPEIKQKRYFKGVMKIRNLQGELFGVRNLFDFKPKTGFSTSVMKREMDLEAGYAIKLDVLRKLKEKTEAVGVDKKKKERDVAAVPLGDLAEPAPHDEAKDSINEDEDMKSPILPLAIQSPPPPSLAPDAATSSSSHPAAADPVSFLPPERDEKDQLLDEYAYALTIVPDTLPSHAGETQVSPHVSDDEGEVDLSVLLEDDEDADRNLGSSDDEDESKPATASSSSSSRKSSNGPSSAAMSKLLTSSGGMIARQEFQRITKGSRMEHTISATAQKVYKDQPLPEPPSGRGRGRSPRVAFDPSSIPTATASSSPLIDSFLLPRPKAAKAPPLISSADTSTVKAVKSPPPLAVASSSSAVAPPLTAAASASTTASEPASSPFSPPPSGVLSSKLDAFSLMAQRYGFANVHDFARYLKDSKLSKDEIADMIRASKDEK